MTSEIPALLAVTGAQLLVYVLPPLLIARRLTSPASWPISCWWALLLGLSSQAILGLIWGHLIHQAPEQEAIVWLAGWTITSLVCLARPAPQTARADAPLSLKACLLLGTILLTGFWLRSIHPLQHAALGQSDAYSHLQFIQEVIEHGQIDNRLYPPGHAWVMGLPAIIFHLDPYIMARFGGAFFGLALILAVYALVRPHTLTPTAAMIAAFLAGCFPAFTILQKTSVGVFANQMGLFLIPSLLAIYLIWRNKSFQWGPLAIGFSIGLAAMMASTPIMLIHLIILIGTERLASCFLDGVKTLRTLPRFAVTLIPAILLLTFHLTQSNPRAIGNALQILNPNTKTAGTEAVPPILKAPDVHSLQVSRPPARRFLRESDKSLSMIYDFFVIKRIGFHNGFIDLAGLTIICVFCFCFAYGWKARHPPFMLLGLWGGLTAIQLVTGWLQFSMYQREGWSLLIALIVLAAGTGSILWERFYHLMQIRVVLIAGVMLTLIYAFLNPPGHSYFSSTAEDDLVSWIKVISQHCAPSGRWPASKLSDQSKRPILDSLNPRYSPVVITRRMAGWDSGQGELVRIIGRDMPTMIFEPIAGKRPDLDPHRQYIFLMETRERASPLSASPSFFTQNAQPEMARLFQKVRATEASRIEAMEAFISENSSWNWTLTRTPLSPRLNAAILTPCSPRKRFEGFDAN